MKTPLFIGPDQGRRCSMGRLSAILKAQRSYVLLPGGFEGKMAYIVEALTAKPVGHVSA
jgi:hypothetical protein